MTWKKLRGEIDTHIEEKARELMDAGVPETEAWQRARRAFGNATLLTEESRDVWIWTWLERLWQDLVYARRVLMKHPGFTVIAVLSLALGVGANAAMFSLADALLLRPLPVPDPGGVLFAGTLSAGEEVDVLQMSYSDYRDYRDRNRSFTSIAATTFTRARLTSSPNQLPELRAGQLVTGNFFDTMLVTPALGRVFLPEEDSTPGRDAVMVLSHKLWQLQFAGDPSVIGRTIQVNGIPFTIVGVMTPEFTGADQWFLPEFYVPMMMWPRLAEGNPLEDRGLRLLDVKGRLKDGVSIEQARAEAGVIGAALEREYPASNRGYRMTVRTELGQRSAEAPVQVSLVAMMLLLSGAVLLVACANVAGLLTCRAPTRAREIAIRLATGAGRARIVRQLLTESFVLGLLGAAAGLAVGYAGVVFLKQIPIVSDVPIGLSFRLDERVVLFSLAAAMLSVGLFGLAPALRTASLKPLRTRTWGRAALVVSQVAISIVLLTIASFMYLTFQRELLAGPGVRTDHILVATLDPAQAGYTTDKSALLYETLLNRATSIPGVRSAAMGSGVLGGQDGESMNIVPEGIDLPPEQQSLSVMTSRIDERFANTMQLPLLRGRTFTATDNAAAPLVAIINEAAAARYWPGQEPVGKRLRLSDPQDGRWLQVVGVVKTGKYTWLAEPPLPFLYVPYAQHHRSQMTLLLETEGDPASVAAPLREAVRALDANLPVFRLRTFQRQFEDSMLKPNLLIIQLVAAMGGMGVLLALTGLYGLIAYNVITRRREIGIRLAIGAGRGNVLAMILRHSMMLAAVGALLGLALSGGATLLMASAFPGNKHPLSVYLLVGSSVFLMAIFATLVPARRAARVDPAIALRQE